MTSIVMDRVVKCSLTIVLQFSSFVSAAGYVPLDDAADVDRLLDWKDIHNCD